VGINLLHQNICGISNKVHDLELYIDELGKTINYICISEHFLNKASAPLLTLSNYCLASYNTRVHKKRGGTLILALNSTEFSELDVCKTYYKMDYFEITGIKDKLSNINLCCLYRNPDNTNLDSFMQQLDKLLDYFFNKKCIIGGDFNINLLVDDNKRKDFLLLLKCYNFRCLVKESTFKRNHAESCIDNFITNLPESVIKDYKVDHNNLADGHAGIQCDLVIENCYAYRQNNEENIVVETRVFNDKNNADFRHSIVKVNWAEMGINCIIKKLGQNFRNSFKKKKKKFKINSTTKSKWITRGIRVASKMKRFLKTNCKITNDHTITDYCSNYLRIYRKVIRCARRISVQSELNKGKNTSKSIWQVVNKYRNKRDLNKHNNITLKINDKIVNEPIEVVDIFSDYFKDVATINPSCESAMDLLEQSIPPLQGELKWTIVTPFEICKIIKGMAAKNSVGHDEIPIVIIKKNIDLLQEPLAHLYNKCYNQGIFPDQFKIAKIIPIYKKGPKNNPKNYRPISLLPTLSKIFEKVIKIRLIRHLSINKILSDRQFGYKVGVSTGDAINSLINDIVIALNNKMKVAALFLDLSSAFDTVDHQILLRKLEHYGLRGKTLHLLHSYLKNRQQYVVLKSTVEGKIEETKSKMNVVKRGVPQGSILGPILFVIFTNDLIASVSKLISCSIKIVAFADDTNAIIPAQTCSELEKNVNEALSTFQKWFTINNFKLNTDKTNAIIFKTTSRNKDSIDVRLDGKYITIVDNVKFLGVHVDAYLNWKSETESIVNTVSSACYALKSLREIISIDHLKAVYFALVESKLRYSIMFWGNSYQYNMRRVFTVQKRAIRTMVRIPQTQSCKEHFKRLGILTAPSLYILVLLTDFMKHLSRYETEDQTDTRLATRTKNMKLPFTPNLQVVEHSSHIQSVKIFNRLPMNLKCITNCRHFNLRLRDFLLKGCYYNIEEI
jgi:ribosomal protein S16